MNSKTAEILATINRDFYHRNHVSFSATRKSSWPGWGSCLELIGEALPRKEQVLSVFDLACGNLRFRDFLTSKLPDLAFSWYAVDNCDPLVPQSVEVHYQNLDILDVLQKTLPLSSQIEAPPCELAVCFGFLHHVPTQEYREELLQALVRQTQPGGYMIVSFWQFLNNEALATRAKSTHQRALEDLGLTDLAGLEDNDFLLGWENRAGAYRYCHSFSETEIDQLLASIANRTTLLSRFVSDGRTNNLNTYAVLRA